MDLKVQQIPGVTISPNCNAEVTFSSKKHPELNRNVQVPFHFTLYEIVKLLSSVKLEKKPMEFKLVDKTVTFTSKKEEFKLVFK